MKGLAAVVLALALAAAGALASGPGSDWPQWLGPSHDGASSEKGVFVDKAAVRLRKAWSQAIPGGRSGLAVADDRLYTLVADEEAEYALALSATDGTERWRVKLDPVANPDLGPASTPAVAGGRVFTLSTACQLRALDAESGRVAWAVDLKARFGNQLRLGCLNSPFVEGGRLVVPPVHHQGHLYGFGGDDLLCLEGESGRERWKEKTYPGSLILVDGHLLAISTVSGVLRVVEATPAAYREKGRLEVLGRGPACETPPSFANGRIFVRNEEEIAAVEVGG